MPPRIKLLSSILFLTFVMASCGSEGSGGGGSGGTPDGGAACNTVCNSECSANIAGIPSDFQQCFDECEASGISNDCSVAIIRFFACLDRNECSGDECMDQAIEFGQCFSLPPE